MHKLTKSVVSIIACIAVLSLVAPAIAETKVVHSTGGDDFKAIQEALDCSHSVKLPDEVYLLSRPVEPGERDTLTGSGPFTTSLESTNRNGLVVLKHDGVTLRDFAVTQNARRADPNEPTDFGDYNQGGGYAIATRSGRGSLSDPNDITLDRIYVHDTHTVGVAAFAGVDNWNVTGCRIERTGRGGIVSNGFKNSRFTNNWFGETGDDALAINGMSHSCTVMGNTFVGSGNLGITRSSGIKCHGQAIMIIGNNFHDCHVAISFQSYMKMHRRYGISNGVGRCSQCVFSGNSIYGLADIRETEDGTSRPCAIRIRDTTDLTISNNKIEAITRDGTPRQFLDIARSTGINSHNNTYTGGFSHVTESTGVEFFRDTFHLLDGRDRVFRAYGKYDVRLVFDSCKLSEIPENFMVSEGKSKTPPTVRDIELVPRPRIAFVDSVVSPMGDTVLVLETSHKEFKGNRIHLAHGQPIRIRDGKQSEIVTVAYGDHPAESKTITVSPLTNEYKPRSAWIELAKQPAMEAAE